MIPPEEQLGRLAPRTTYVRGHRGVELAAFLYGIPVGEGDAGARPVVWTHNRYNRGGVPAERAASWRARFPGLGIEAPTPGPELSGPLTQLVDSGYVVALVDIRGTGSSHGHQELPFSAEEALDARAVTRWLAAQPFCTGRVGMAGRSYAGANQHLAAAGDSGLDAIFPEMAPFDLYATVHRGGIFRRQFAASWFADVDRRDRMDEATAVAGDPDRLWQARAEHRANRDLYGLFSVLTHRDSVDPVNGLAPYRTNSPGHDGTAFRAPDAPAYHLGGWFDPFVQDAVLWFANLRGPKRLTIGPWAHSGSTGMDLGREYGRWFGRWLRDEDNGVSDGPPVRYYTIGAPPGQRWRSSDQWPPPGFMPARLHLAGGRTGTVASVNDGGLSTAGGHGEAGSSDEYTTDYATTTGPTSRWTNAYGGPYGYGDLAAEDGRCLTYTTAALAEAVEITGHPLLTCWVSSSAADGDFHFRLEQVGPDGRATYVTEGSLRASHRGVAAAPFDNLGLPYHRGCSTDMLPLGAGPARLLVDLSPISWLFPAGSRIRLSISCSDADNAPAPVVLPPPVVRVHRSAPHASFLDLPVRDPAVLP